MDKHLYEVKFPGGEITELAANIITELMYSRCDVDRNESLLLGFFVVLRKNDAALSYEDQRVIVKGRENLRKAAAGWDICCKWKDSSTSWEN